MVRSNLKKKILCVCVFNKNLVVLEKYTALYVFLFVTAFFILGRKGNCFALDDNF